MLMYYTFFRAIDTQGLIGNIGGYIGLVLGYSLLQIPDFIIFIVRRTDGWRSEISKRRYHNNSKTWNVMVHERAFTSKGILKQGLTENWDGRAEFARMNVLVEDLMKRVVQLETSTYEKNPSEQNEKLS